MWTVYPYQSQFSPQRAQFYFGFGQADPLDCTDVLGQRRQEHIDTVRFIFYYSGKNKCYVIYYYFDCKNDGYDGYSIKYRLSFLPAVAVSIVCL